MDEETQKSLDAVIKQIMHLEERFDKMKTIISTYFSMSNNFALESLKTSLKEV